MTTKNLEQAARDFIELRDEQGNLHYGSPEELEAVENLRAALGGDKAEDTKEHERLLAVAAENKAAMAEEAKGDLHVYTAPPVDEPVKKEPEAKKPEAKKPEAKKPEAKKPEAKKPEAKKFPSF